MYTESQRVDGLVDLEPSCGSRCSDCDSTAVFLLKPHGTFWCYNCARRLGYYTPPSGEPGRFKGGKAMAMAGAAMAALSPLK